MTKHLLCACLTIVWTACRFVNEPADGSQRCAEPSVSPRCPAGYRCLESPAHDLEERCFRQVPTCEGGPCTANACDGGTCSIRAPRCPLRYLDRDGDGYGEETSAEPRCESTPGLVVVAGDCNDRCPSCYPGAPEMCDERDNDCDGKSDEGCPGPIAPEHSDCEVGGSEPCVTGLTEPCSAGMRRCSPAGQWEDCAPPPSCICEPGETRMCADSLPAACDAGKEVCSEAGTWGACEPVDACECEPGAGETCDTGLAGSCAGGMRRCGTDGSWEACVALQDDAETCNETDDDCDGKVDEGLSDCLCESGAKESCDTGMPGRCQAGERLCGSTSHWESCMGLVQPAAESCNQQDDDCDGSTDEDAVCECEANVDARSCVTGLPGVCAVGRESCSATGTWLECEASIAASTETCSGADEDCDGVVEGDGCGEHGLCAGGSCVCGEGYRECGEGRCVPDGACCYCTATEICCPPGDDCGFINYTRDWTPPLGPDGYRCRGEVRDPRALLPDGAQMRIYSGFPIDTRTNADHGCRDVDYVFAAYVERACSPEATVATSESEQTWASILSTLPCVPAFTVLHCVREDQKPLSGP